MALDTLKHLIQKHLPVNDLLQSLQEHRHIRLERFIGSSLSFLFDAYLKRNQRLLVIYPDHESALFMKSDLDVLLDEESSSFLLGPTAQKPYDARQMVDSTVLVQRSETLQDILNASGGIVVTSAEAIFDKLPSPQAFEKQSILLKKGHGLALDEFIAQLLDHGYSEVNFVENPGEFARRGGILDIFPFNTDYPVRMELFGDEIDSIREFDISTQRSVSFMNEVRIVPNLERSQENDKQSLFHWLNSFDTIALCHFPLIAKELDTRYEQAQHQYQSLKDVTGVAAPELLFLSGEKFQQEVSSRKLIHFGSLASQVQAEQTVTLKASPQPDFNASIKLLQKNIEDCSAKAFDVYILCDSNGQKDRFEGLLGDFSEQNRYHLIQQTLHEGFILEEAGIALYTDHQVFNRYHRPQVKRRRTKGGLSVKEMKNLNVGDYVVHVDYGIGKFAGFKRITVNGIQQESVVLHYKDDSVMYVNVSSLHKLQKYSGKDGIAPAVTKLGSGEWQKKKAKTKSRLKDIARELIQLYAKRKATKAFQFSPDNNWMTELEASFEFEETPDQMEAILSVKEDMEQPSPMDRLVCGDVGFGKTEVAVRAAFKAVMDQKQVAVLVPTTILADQHQKTFSRRMKEFPLRVEALSRFVPATKQKEVLEKLKKGDVDIVIGTHRLLSKDVQFKDFGLIIIDEEQRFGVAAKEKLKEFRAAVDVLTLTATPIPRTLHMSLMGARDLSTITTPPPNRQPVYTEIHVFDSALIRDAIMQELSRGGQVFFIHNRVQNIQEFTGMIQEIVPNARIRFAHGQMTGSELEAIISDFYQHKFDVLISTNIVENGIDISNANTIIINNANHFGLSELHQLRGRVGRSNRKAYCYLITPPMEDLTAESRKRLMALEEFSDLGAGIHIAMRDLDIRGAGDILGAEQSGFINEIGFELYTKILNEAVRELKETEFKDLFEDLEIQVDLPETQVEFDVAALLPVLYVEDNVERLNLYRRIAKASTESELDQLSEEVQDRFGALPEAAVNLFTAAKIKLFASHMRFEKVIIRGGRMWLQCMSTKTEEGKAFYETGTFQLVLEKVQQAAGASFKLVQKDDAVRFVISDIASLTDAVCFLKPFYEPIKSPEFI